jgi:hypothetical protein
VRAARLAVNVDLELAEVQKGVGHLFGGRGRLGGLGLASAGRDQCSVT